VFGTASAAQALTGSVSIKDSSLPAQEKTTAIDGTGAFKFDVGDLKPPFVLRTDVHEEGSTRHLHAMSVGGTTHINPLTDAAVAGAAGGLDPSTLYDQPDREMVLMAAKNLPAISADLRAALAPLLERYAVTDPVTDSSPDADLALRVMLRDVRIEVEAGEVVVTNRHTGGVIYAGPAGDPIAGTFHAANLMTGPEAPTPPTGADAPAPEPIAPEAHDTPLPATLGAFPGCEGSGCETRGGFTMTQGTPMIYRVTSLAAGTGAGTLGQCIAARGPRVCVFAVSGTIKSSGYTIANPYITIDGRTAPGGGIQLTGEGATPNVYGMLWIRTHNVVIRGLRLRPGWSRAESGGGAHSLLVYPAGGAATHHIVLDHNSMQFASDENVGIAGENGAAIQPSKMTLSYNIVAESMDRGGSDAGVAPGVLVGAGNDAQATGMVDIDMHHNYFASNTYRNPLFYGNTLRFVNNILFNWRAEPVSVRCDATADVVNNLAKTGPATTHSPAFDFMDAGFEDISACKTSGDGIPSIFLTGNKYAGGAVQGWDTGIVREYGMVSRRTSSMAAATTGPAIAVESADTLTTSVLGAMGAGASHRLDCGGRMVPNRDTTDARVAVTEWSTPATWVTGRDVIAGWGGYPTVSPTVAASRQCSAASRDNANCACADLDADGMPDYWEISKCGSATGCIAFDVGVAPPWTNLEAFLSGGSAVP
jgi:hypothetical protein